MNMTMIVRFAAGAAIGLATACGVHAGPDAAASAQAAPGGSAITVYNGGFALVREKLNLTLDPGESRVRFSGTTAHADPDSVILRDAAGKRTLRVLEQNYRADAISEGLLLNQYEGKTIGFEVFSPMDGKRSVVEGTIIRSGYVPHYAAFSRYGNEYMQSQMARSSYDGGGGTPLIKVAGKLVFALPGRPLFPELPDDSILMPSFDWILASDHPGPVTAELSYISGGMSWQADYNVLAPAEQEGSEAGVEEPISLVGWVTVDNQSGKTFDDVRLKLMAGDVNKIRNEDDSRRAGMRQLGLMRDELSAGGAPVSEKAFDELHLYNINRRTTLRDRETKQVEFVKAENVKSKRRFIYDGAAIDPQAWGWNEEAARQNKEYGTKCNPKVWVMREFKNSKENGLGVPLPRGTLRFYRADTGPDAGREFTGENIIDHTPTDELVRVYTGNSFDLVGERVQTDFKAEYDRRWLNESVSIKLRNHKKLPAEVTVVEHLYRGVQWEVQKPSQEFKKSDSKTIEFTVTVPPDGEREVTYTAHYTW